MRHAYEVRAGDTWRGREVREFACEDGLILFLYEDGTTNVVRSNEHEGLDDIGIVCLRAHSPLAGPESRCVLTPEQETARLTATAAREWSDEMLRHIRNWESTTMPRGMYE